MSRWRVRAHLSLRRGLVPHPLSTAALYFRHPLSAGVGILAWWAVLALRVDLERSVVPNPRFRCFCGVSLRARLGGSGRRRGGADGGDQWRKNAPRELHLHLQGRGRPAGAAARKGEGGLRDSSRVWIGPRSGGGVDTSGF